MELWLVFETFYENKIERKTFKYLHCQKNKLNFAILYHAGRILLCWHIQYIYIYIYVYILWLLVMNISYTQMVIESHVLQLFCLRIGSVLICY